MTILLTGGGSGGHITPLLAVARELKKKSPGVKLHYVGERNSKFSHILDENKNLFQKDSYIFAGKFRRYHGEPWLKKIADVRTILLNLRDFLFFLAGFFQSVYSLGSTRPDVIFIKGGYVGLPIGMAARLLRIPYITHDSDAVSGLTNRLIGKGAALNAVGMPGGFYNYPKEKIVPLGIPSRDDFKRLSGSDKVKIKRELSLPEKSRILLITGGSQGARRLNSALIKIIPSLLRRNSDLVVIHQLGLDNKGQYERYRHPRLIKFEFIDELAKYSAVADLIITRAGASALSEYSDQAKPCIVVPSPYLSGGHQLRNGDVLRQAEAASIMSEDEIADSKHAEKAIQNLLEDTKQRQAIGRNLSKFMIHGASSRIAERILGYKKI